MPAGGNLRGAAWFQVQAHQRGNEAMRVIITAVVFSALLTGAVAAQQDSGLSSGKSGTQSPAPTTGMGGNGAGNTGAQPNAPVGHRQPTQRDLPPSIRDSEKSPRSNRPDPYGPLPQICRNC
jgi:hypothetical protein